MGLTHLAWSSLETFLDCYAEDAPAEDTLKCTCRMASLLAQRGRFNDANELMEKIPEHILRVLKYQQAWTFFARMLKLRRHLHRHDINAAEYLLTQLQGQGPPDVEAEFSLSILRVDFLARRGVYDQAMDLIESIAKNLHEENADVLAQIKLLTAKARLWAKCGQPLKGFSIAVRAANMANRARVLPALWESSSILSNILITLREYSAALEVLEAIVPQVLECQDCDLAARTYALLVDAHMGLAGEAEAKSRKRKEWMSKAMEYIDSAFEEFRRIEDLKGQCEMLAKKATIMHLSGDLVLANDCSSRYLDIKKAYQAARA